MGGTEADVAGGGEIDAEPVAVAVEEGDDGFLAGAEGGDGGLVGEDGAAEEGGAAGGVDGGGGGQGAGGGGRGDVEAWRSVSWGWVGRMIVVWGGGGGGLDGRGW